MRTVRKQCMKIGGQLQTFPYMFHLLNSFFVMKTVFVSVHVYRFFLMYVGQVTSLEFQFDSCVRCIYHKLKNVLLLKNPFVVM